MRVQPGDDQRRRYVIGCGRPEPGMRHRLEGRDGSNSTLQAERETLHSRQTHAQSGKRPGARRHGKEIDVSQRDLCVLQRRQEVSGQPFTVCPRRIARPANEKLTAAPNRHATRSCRRVET